MENPFNITRSNGSVPNKRLTESITFRVDKLYLDELRQTAERSRVSLNTLISQIFHRYLTWWRHQETLGFMPLSFDALRLIFAKLGAESASEIGKQIGSNTHKEMILHLYGGITKQSVLKYLEVFSARFKAYNYTVEGSRHVINIHHDINEAFSTYVDGLVSSILKLVDVRVTSVCNPNAVTFTFEVV